jgi:hypothetical protein
VRNPKLPAATLLVGTFHSHCNACGQECDPKDNTHDTIISYGPNNGVAGCGIRWTYVYSTYIGTRAERAVQGFRPDLVFVDPPEVPGQQFVD